MLTTSACFNRRSFLSSALLGGVGVGALALAGARRAEAAPAFNLPDSDIAILKFLSAAEQVESDLWGQYSELATGNPGYRTALRTVDRSMPDYVNGDFEDEQSHADLINAVLGPNNAVDLSPFKTIMPPALRGLQPTGRITNLRSLTVDTSFYARYRGTGNPDFGDTFPQIVTITNQPTIPLNDSMAPTGLAAIAQSAAFHFASIEQGGSSLYTAMIQKVTDANALAILAAIGPTEVYHFSLFQSTLENILPLRIQKRPIFPNFRANPARGMILPHPCKYFGDNLPLNSVIRPSTVAKAGAVATANFLVSSGLFQGQPPAFLAAVSQLAADADAAVRAF